MNTALAALLFVFSFTAGAQVSTFDCSEERNSDIQLVLSFKKKVLTEVEFVNFPTKDAPASVTFGARDLRKETYSPSNYPGSTIETYELKGLEKFNLETSVFNVDFSYYTKLNGKLLSLEESFKGNSEEDDSSEMGRIRLDLSDDAGICDVSDCGFTLFFTCKKNL